MRYLWSGFKMVVSHFVWFLVALWIAVYLWRRRGLYAASWRLSGPFAWPLIGNALFFADIPKIHKNVESLWLTYGSPMRFWLFQKFIVFVTNPRHMEIIMNGALTADRGQVSSIIDDIVGRPGLFTSRGDEWKHHRKCLNPTMHLKIVNSYYPIFNKWNHRLVKQLEPQLNGVSFNIFDYLDKTTLSMICDSLFDYEVNVDNEKEFNFLEAVNNLMQTIGLKMYQPWYNVKLIFRLSSYYPAFKRSLDGIDDFLRMLINVRIREVRATIAEELKNGLNAEVINGKIPKPDNYIRHCMRLVEGNLMSFEDVMAETKTMLAGGFETTANAGSYIVLMMAMHPTLQDQLFDEMRTIFASCDSPVGVEDVHQMIYTERFIKETLRLFPVVPLASRYADEDTNLGDCVIPKGAEIILGIYCMQRDATIWGADAARFDPERFLPDRIANVHPYAYLPFSAGLHNCIGARYGNLALRMLVAWLVRNYRFSTDLRMDDLNFRMDITLKLLNGHMVRIERRMPF